ncbi:Maf family protein [Gordonia aichiensis]|uniref:Nucleoside triphosphate pyrophosphatase n=1 Tax=Gordonia aichiensis NBRC 108223 TaxID=1220583 RepID=L7KIZ9_9ACTN|nr:Maf family protein [Gordonia aichiensis]GAC48569.1 Maf-like protein [Gordonia aichiensis NBRC 108223]
MSGSADGRHLEVVLGSASPARLSVLRHAGLDPRVVVSEVDEDHLLTTLAAEAPGDAVTRLAQAKADSVIRTLLGERLDHAGSADAQTLPDLVVLTCDSMLLHRGTLTGKPHSAEVAIEQWKRLRGDEAQLLTGHCVSHISGLEVVGRSAESASTVVRFADVDDDEINAYVSTGEPLEVAGAFTLDGRGGWFIESIDGDPSSVIGIGLPTVRHLLRRLGIPVSSLWTSNNV